jgi:secreted PhoX family phosphatase
VRSDHPRPNAQETGVTRPTRRRFLRSAAVLGAGLCSGPNGLMAGSAQASVVGADAFGPLQPPDPQGLMLPPEFSARVVAVAERKPIPSAATAWHRAPDGGATFARPDGGWVYVSNSERSLGRGGARALAFNAEGEIIDAYSVLSGTTRNCAGGPTPWNTWISCEETDFGYSFECDPLTPGSQGVARPGLGRFRHEAAAVDPETSIVYLTEDESNGLLYRFRPDAAEDLSQGVLEALEILDPDGQGPIAPGQVRPVGWHTIPNPAPSSGLETRFQASQASAFDRGEGIGYADGFCYFATTGDNRVWSLDLENDLIRIFYDASTSADPQLTNPDNLWTSPTGDVLVAEDAGNLEIVALTPSGAVKPIVRVTGQSGTEITGPALSPDGTRLYFSSQRAPSARSNRGVTYEVTGPFVQNSIQDVPLIGPVGTAALALSLGWMARRWLKGEALSG